MVILLLSVLAAVAIPNFIDFRTDAKNAATQGAIGAVRSALSIAVAAVSLKEDPTLPSPKYPTILELQGNTFTSSHPNLSGVSIMDPSSGLPKNPWSVSTASTAWQNSVFHCSSATKGDLTGTVRAGWCYRETAGSFWANTNVNGSTGTKTENYY